MKHKPTFNRSRLAVAIAALGVELPASQAPTDIRLIPAGEFRSWDGRPTECAAWIMTDEDGQRIVAEAAAAGRDFVLDYEHATLKAKVSGNRAPAAGWYKRLEWRPGDGLWAIGVNWTAQAAEHIAAREYRYTSPVFSYDPKTGRVLQLFHASLTNEPALDGYTDLAALAAEFFLIPNSQEELMNELLKKLLAALGLQETATETEALSAVAGLKTNVAALSAQVAAPDPSKFVPVATLSALQGEHATLQGKYTALQAEVDGAKLDKVVADGLTAGKLTPATEPWARDLGKKDLAALSAYIAAAPVIAKPGGTQSGGNGGGGATVALSAEQKKVCELLGVAEADFQQNLSA